MSIEDGDKIKAHNELLAAMIEEHSSWKEHYIEIANYTMTRKGRFLGRDDGKPNDGKKRNSFINNGAGGRYLKTSAAGLQQGLTSPSRPWYRLTLTDKDLAEYKPVKLHLEDVRVRMNAMYGSSNTYVATHGVYKELLGFATAPMIMEASQKDIIRCTNFTAGEYFLASNEEGEIDTIYRLFPMTAREIYLKFGEKANENRAIHSALDNNRLGEWFKVVHAIKPNSDREYEKVDNLNMPWVSDYYLFENNEDTFLRKSGYEMFPCMTPRWDVTGSDIYGIGPGMETLADIKMLQSMEGKVLKALDKQIDPALNVPTAMKGKVINLLPGGINYSADGANNQITPINKVDFRIGEVQEKIDQVKHDIKEGMYADLFKMLISADDPNKTATEIIKKHEEKLSLLGPVIERLQPEMLDKMIARGYFLGLRAGIFPPRPPEMEGVDIEIEYVSPLAQAQKMLGTASIEDTFNFTAALRELYPEVVDNLNADEAVAAYSDMKGTPVQLLRPKEEVKAIRRDRAERQRIEKQAETIERSAGAIKNLAAVSPEQSEAMAAITGSMGIGNG